MPKRSLNNGLVQQTLIDMPTEDSESARSPIRDWDFQGQNVKTYWDGDDPWFIAADVCRVLGIGNVSQAVAPLEGYQKGICETDTLGGKQSLLTVNESGLYMLIFRSNKAAAKEFQRWVTCDVLPSIRKFGYYEHPNMRMVRKEAKRLGDPKDLVRAQNRIRNSGLNADNHGLLKSLGAGMFDYIRFHEDAYLAMFGETPRKIRSRRGLRKRLCLLDHMSAQVLVILVKADTMLALRVQHAGGSVHPAVLRDWRRDEVLKERANTLGEQYAFSVFDHSLKIELVRKALPAPSGN